MKINLLKTGAIITLLSAIFIPYLDILGVFHISLFFLGLTFILVTVHKKLKIIHYIILLILIAWPLCGSFVAATIYFFPMEIDVLRSFGSLFVLFLAYFCFNVVRFDYKEIYELIVLILTIVSLMIIIQLLYPGASLLSIYIPENRVGVLKNYAVIMAPIGNPNNMGLFISLLMITSLNMMKLRKANISKYYIYFNQAVLMLGIIFSYARTVLVGFVLSVLSLLPQNDLNYKRIAKLAVYFGIFLLIFILFDGNEMNIRQMESYKKILNPFEDNSFTTRFDFWLTSLNILIQNPLLLISGLGWFRGALMQLQGHTTIDSSYIYILLSYGIIFFSIFFVSIICLIKKYPKILPLFILLLIVAINMAYITDYRLNIILAFFISTNVKIASDKLK